MTNRLLLSLVVVALLCLADGRRTLRYKKAIRRGRLGSTSWLMPTMIPTELRVLLSYGAQLGVYREERGLLSFQTPQITCI